MRATDAQRTCVACRAVRPKSELVRFVRLESGETMVDPGGKRPVRGAYVCPGTDCLCLALKRGSLARALRTSIPRETMERLTEEMSAIAGPDGA